MFELTQQTLRLAHVNPRIEKHGDERVPAVDIRLVYRTSNDALAWFDPGLKAALYSRPETEDLVADPGHMPNLRFPLLLKFRWAKEYAGYGLTWHAGVDARDDIVLDMVDLDRFGVECMEGGTVEISFRARSNKVDPSIIGRLCGQMESPISISLTPPAADDLAGASGG